MNRKLTACVAAVVLAAASGVSFADNGFYGSARVVAVKPLYETVQISHPEERCWNEEVYHRRGHRSSYTPAIAGAIAGGVVGNQFGSGRGKDVMTAAGAVLGASIGRDIAHGAGPGYVTVERRCETVDHYESRDELVGYRVKYRYKGDTYWTRTNHHPGDRIRVKVNVEPVWID